MACGFIPSAVLPESKACTNECLSAHAIMDHFLRSFAAVL